MKRKYVLFVLLMALLAPLAMNAQGLMKTLGANELQAVAQQGQISLETPMTREAGWLEYETDSIAGFYSLGLSSYTFGVMFPSSMLDDNNTLSAVAFVQHSSMTGDVVINVYSGGTEAPDNLLHTETVATNDSTAWRTVELSDVYFDPTENLWITLTVEGGTGVYPLPLAYLHDPDPNGALFYYNGNWYDVNNLVTAFNGLGWLIAGYVENITISCATPTNLQASNITTSTAVLTWSSIGEETAWQIVYSDTEGFNPDNATPIDVTERTYTLTNLSDDTEYYVYVRSNCGDGAYSAWSEMASFYTPWLCDKPFNLETSDITYNSANLSWDGWQDTYNVQYTPMTKTWEADFSDGIPEGWTLIDNDGDGNNWTGGEGYVYSESWNSTSGALTPDNWLVTPKEVPMGGKLYITAYGMDPSYAAERFAVYYSSRGGDNITRYTKIAGDFVTTGTPTIYEVNLSNYSGEAYIAIRHYNVSDEFRLVVSAMATYTAGETVTVENVTSPYPMENLTEETFYTVQVQGNCSEGETDWSETHFFYTTAICLVPTDLESTDVTHNSATLSWTGEPEGYNLRYRTASYNEVLFYDSFENGVSNWTQSDGGVYTGIPYDGTHMYLFWGDAEPHYLITPELTGLDRGGYIMFYFRYYQGAMTFNVGYSSTTADITAFEWDDEVTSTNSYSLYLDAIPEGTKYIAIQSTGTNEAYALLIDYFVVYGPTVQAGEWTPLNNVENPYTLQNLDVDTEYEWQVQTISDNCEGGFSDWSESDYFHTESGLIFLTDGNWNDGANWYLGEVPADFSDVTVNASAIIPADYDAKVNTVTFGEGGSITIKDGGQLHGNDYVTATVEKEITSYEGNDNYYLIANPLRYSVNPTTTATGLLDGDYDLYGFNATEEMLEWRNYKTEAFNIRTGFGYLYANGEDVTLQFTGQLVPQHNNLYYNAVELSYDEDNDQLNWNLVGNMYGHNGYVYVGGVDNGYVVFAENQYYYKMNEAGTDVIASNEIVKPCEGVFVQSSDTAQYAFFSSVPHNISSKGLDMNLVQDNNLIDVVLIRFGEGRNLQKFQLNPNHTKVYMTEGDKDYSVLFAKDNGMMPVSFKAEKEGNYTLSFTSREITYSYLHLIDNLTNTEVDLLANPEYTFKTEAGDFAKRFTIVYEVK